MTVYKEILDLFLVQNTCSKNDIINKYDIDFYLILNMQRKIKDDSGSWRDMMFQNSFGMKMKE